MVLAAGCLVGPDPELNPDDGVDAGTGAPGCWSAAGIWDPECDLPEPTREPTPCLDARDPDAYPVRKISEGSTEPSSEPSTGLVIFDRSGSMAASWDATPVADPPTPRSKWHAAGEALLGAVGPVADRVTLGAIFFPQPDECVVAPIEDPGQVSFRPGDGFVTAWAVVAPQNPPTGATPLEAAFIQAERALEAACVAGLLEQRSYVMVLTDGEPNCGTDMTHVEAMAASWRARGVPTYVFGLPGSEDASAVLEGLSTAGGTEALIVPGSPGELGEDLAVIM